ncbi:phage tail tape measure protein [Escherichia coli]|nr:phage tail tape measure protein [Escherichia coli]
MDQIANLVIDLGIDAAEFKNEIPRIKNLLNGAASDAERSSARMQRFMERQTQAARQTMQAASSAATAASVHAQTVEKSAQAHERMAREVEQTRQRMEALSQKMREEQAQAMALAEAQDKAAAAFYRQIDSVKQASAGLQELQRIQQQIRQARNSGGIGQQDYLALISEVTAKTRVLTQAEEEATRQKVAFIRQLKEQATRQNLSSSELLRAKAAQLGVSSAAEVYIRKMEQAGKATHSLGLKSAAARQEIGVLIGELARGNLGALRGSGITLANRAGWIDTLMSPKGMMIAALQEKVSRAKRLPWTASSSQVEYDQQRLNDLQEKKRQKDLQDAKEQAERNYQEQQKRRNAENAALNRMNETEAARHQSEIARINSMQYADQAVRDAAIQRENERYEKALASGKKKTRETRNDEATRLLLQYSQQQAQVEGQIAAARQSAGIATEKMTEAHKQLLALQQRISDLDGKKLTADEKSVLARKDELIQALTLLDVKQQELQKQTALNDLKKKTIQLTSQLAEEERAQRQQHDLDIATVGMGDQQRQRYQVQLSLRQKYQQQLEQLRRDSEQKGTYNTDDYRKAEQALTESLNRQLNENRRYWQQLEVVQGNWKNGVLRAFQDFTVDADNTAGTAEQVFSSAFSNMGNGLATFVTTGKLNFKSFTSSVLSDMAKILAQATMMKSIKGIGSVLGFDLSSLSLNANGGIYQSADLSRYSGTVVNRPTFFAFAKGAGVMGEAGPEAILPLRRGADGKLGVVADIGGSGMAMFAPQYNIEINNDGTNGQIGPAALKVVYDLGKKAAADFMQQQARDGGRLSGAYR